MLIIPPQGYKKTFSAGKAVARSTVALRSSSAFARRYFVRFLKPSDRHELSATHAGPAKPRGSFLTRPAGVIFAMTAKTSHIPLRPSMEVPFEHIGGGSLWRLSNEIIRQAKKTRSLEV